MLLPKNLVFGDINVYSPSLFLSGIAFVSQFYI